MQNKNYCLKFWDSSKEIYYFWISIHAAVIANIIVEIRKNIILFVKSPTAKVTRPTMRRKITISFFMKSPLFQINQVNVTLQLYQI